jgi:serine/threonine protein kinase
VSSFLAYTKVKVLRRNGRCRYKYHTDLAETDLYNLIISNRTVLPFNEKINIIAQVAAKLKDLHKNGICHLAIIPSNVLRFKDGRVQLCGYGDATGIGKRVKLQGEQGYVAPEIFQKEKPAVNPKLDMWSLGSLMYELLSDGDCAFRGAIEEFPEENPDTLLRRKQNTEARAKELCSKLSERSKADPQHETIYRLAARCIDADPEKRPTAEEVLQILKTLEETP